MKSDRNDVFKNAKRVVVKLGSGILTSEAGLNAAVIHAVSDEISTLMDVGKQVILVSSGAVASGMKKMKLKEKPSSTPAKQATAAIGQAGLILAYEEAFHRHDKNVAQMLLTHNDIVDKKRYLNARNTLNTLLDWQVLPVINENDTVATDELKFGDNDNLSAMIALLMNADVLINLTDIDGVYDKDPRIHGDAVLMPEITTIDVSIEQAASAIPGAVGTGGMLSKIKAAKKTTAAGVPMVIASGKDPNILKKLFDGKKVGTFFVPGASRMESKKRWLAFNAKVDGELILDEGAVEALLTRGKSLLPSGIVAVSGTFEVGATVHCSDQAGTLVATGLSNYAADDIRKIKGKKSDDIADILGSKNEDEVIHRNNMAILKDTLAKK